MATTSAKKAWASGPCTMARRVGEQDHPQPAEDALGDHGRHRHDAERAQAAAARPQRHGQRQR